MLKQARSCLVVAMLGGWPFLSFVSAMDQTFIVKDGKPCGQIVIAEKPARAARFAANELQSHVEKMTGAKMEIAAAPGPGVNVYVGVSAHTQKLGLKTDGLAHGAYRVASGKDWVAFLGPDKDFEPIEPWPRSRADNERVLAEWDKASGDTFAYPHFRLYNYYLKSLDLWDFDDRGTVNAVHDYLRGLGVRWYFPGELGTVIPKTTDLPLPQANKTVKPDFDLRRYSFYYTESASPDELLWRQRLGLNIGDEILGLTQACHGAKFVTTRAEFKKAYPEMYALWGGKRATDHRECGAPCLSSDIFHEKHLKFAHAVFNHFKEPMLSLDVCDGYGAGICGCDKCKGLGTPERGWRGSMSDYVWGYVNRVAQELHKTHPDRMVSGLSYSAYMLPPEKIDQLSPNLALVMCQTRNTFGSRDTRDTHVSLRGEWLKKLPSKQIIIWEYYLQNRPNKPHEGVPAYFPALIAEDLRSLKGVSRGELIEVYNHPDASKFAWDAQAVNHLNIYVTSRLWWDAGQDLGAMLDEYYASLYGPAGKEMKAFVEYSQENWTAMPKQPDKITAALDLLAAAQKAAGDTVYGKRVAMIADYVKPMNQLRERLAKGRENVPNARALEREKGKLKLDGQLDDAFWEGVRTYNLYEIVTGKPARQHTSFKIAWGGDDALYLGIKCMESDVKGIVNGVTANDDPGIWRGDCLELLIETQVHSYYQIAINPAGAVLDMDSGDGARETRWSSGIQVKTFVGEGFWTAEVRLPCAGETARDLDARNGIAGRQPSETYPWFINVCRQRMRGKEVELSAWSPTGKPRFNEPMKFGLVYVK